MPDFTSITFEVLINGAWVDLSADVLADPPPRGSRGIMSNGLMDRVADPGTLTFSLNNSESNSAHVLGYYSPGRVNSLPGWNTGLPVRVTFGYDSWSIIKWRGFINPDGIRIVPGIYDLRQVEVACTDWMRKAADHKMDLTQIESNKYLSEAVELVLANMPIQPASKEYFNEAGTYNPMPLIFDISGTETTALGELNKFAQSQQMYIVLRGGGSGEILYTGKGSPAYQPIGISIGRTGNFLLETGDNFLLETGDKLLLDLGDAPEHKPIPLPASLSGKLLLETGNYFLLETGDKLLLDEGTYPIFGDADMMPGTEIGYGRNIINHVSFTVYPRRRDTAATTVLWKLESETLLEAGETRVIRGNYVDPNGGASKVNYDTDEPVQPVASTDYEANTAADGSGTDMVSSLSVTARFGAAEVELTLKNNHATDSLYTGGPDLLCRVRGRGIYTYNQSRTLTYDNTSMQTYGVKPITFDLRYQDAPDNIDELGDAVLASFAEPQYTIERMALSANRDEFNLAAFLFLEPRDTIYAMDDLSGMSSEATVNVDGVGYKYFVINGYEFEIQGGKYVFWYPILSTV